MKKNSLKSEYIEEQIFNPENHPAYYEPPETIRYVGFVKLMRTADVVDLIARSPIAFALATTIALRARFHNNVSRLTGLQQGEAFLGDYKRCGMTEGQYRQAKKLLEKHRFATFRTTNRGTIAKLMDTSLFDPCNVADYDPTYEQTTSKQRADNGQATTNKNGNNGKTVKNGKTVRMKQLAR
jgi:hypothetical protein